MYKNLQKTIGLPSTDNRTWEAEYNIGDIVKVRVDFRDLSNEQPLQIVSFTKSNQPYKEDSRGNNIGGFIRSENPSGKLYQLVNGQNWEGKDLEPIGSQNMPSAEPSAESGEINEDTEIGKFEEDELEIIQEEEEEDDDEEDDEEHEEDEEEDEQEENEEDEQENKGKKSKKTSKKVNFDELFDRIDRIKKIRYKLPAFIYSFFSFDVTEVTGKIYSQNVCKLALLNRIAKDVLKYKSVIGDEEAQFMLEDIRSLYYNHIEFLYNSTERFGDTYRLKYNNDIENIEITLKDWQNEGKNEVFDFYDQLQLQRIKADLSSYEKTEVTDNQYYRIISLSAIYNPELFNNRNHLKPHLDFIKQYFKINDLAFSNIYNACFTSVIINEEFLYDKLISSSTINSKNLNIYNIIKNNDEYIIYACINILLEPSNTDKLQIFKLKIEDVSNVTNSYTSVDEFELYSSAQRSIWLGLDNFYHYCVQLRSSELNRQISFDNLNKLSKLQVQSYKNFLSDFKLQTVRYGSL